LVVSSSSYDAGNDLLFLTPFSNPEFCTMKNLFSTWFPSRRAWAKPKSRRLRPSVEQMEERCVPAVFSVNSTADILHPPPGVVTLRSAIEAANATPGSNTIKLTVAGTYKITIPPSGSDDNTSGDFDIIPKASSPANSSLTIVNASGGKVVDGNHLDRVFDINPLDAAAPAGFVVNMQGFTIQNGAVAGRRAGRHRRRHPRPGQRQSEPNQHGRHP
jgi:hypothetical protein